MKYVSPLGKDEMIRLHDIMKNNACPRVRCRANAVLLSAKGYKIDEIADIFESDRRTVSSWLDIWEESGFGGLPGKPRSGRPGKLTEEEKEIAIGLPRENPRSVRTVIARLAEMTGKSINRNTLKRLAKSSGLIWKRIRKSARSKRDEKKFKKAS